MTNYAPVGLQGVFLTQAFNAGLKDYLSGLKSAQSSTSKAAEGMSILASGAGGMTSAVGAAGIAIGVAGVAVGVFSAAVGGAAAVMGMLAAQAAPLEGVAASFNAMAVSAGVSLREMRKAAAGTVNDFELMRNANLALTGATGEFRKEFAEALPRLLEGARMTAQGTAQSVDFLFQSLVTGVKRAAPLLIDNTGIVLKVGDATEDYAASIGKTTDALTAGEKSISVLRATLEGIDNIEAALGGTTETLTVKQERNKATFDNIASTLGTYFLPAFKSAADAIDKLASTFLVAISEGGAFYDELVLLGAAASLVADGFSRMVGYVTNAIEDMSDTVETDIVTLISDMFNWGVNMAVSLAEGLIEGAASAIAAAADAIGNMIAYFFRGNSPPRIASDIDVWGADTMNEYLKGFADADFGLLKNVQKGLKSVFDVFVEQGKFTKESASRLWADISQSMAKGLASGDMTRVFSRIKSAAGEYAGVIIKMIQDEQRLAAATNQVKKAEADLEASRKKAVTLDSKRSKLVAEYNQLLRSGASKDALAAKLAEINATEDAQIAAQAEIQTNEDRVDSAKEQASALEDQVKLNQELLAQLTDIAKAGAARETEKAAAKTGGGGGFGTPTEEEGTSDGITFGDAVADGIATAIDAAKERIKLAIGNAITGAITAAKERLAGPLEELRVSWETLTTNLALAWDNLKTTAAEKWGAIQATITGITQPITDWFTDWGNFFSGWWTEHGANLELVITGIVDSWKEIFAAFMPAIQEVIDNGWLIIQEKTELAMGILGTILGSGWETTKENAQIAWDAFTGIVTIAWELLNENVQGFLEILGDIIDVAAAAITGDWDLFWKEVDDLVNTWWTTIQSNIEGWIEAIKLSLTAFYDIGKNTIQGLWDGMIEIWAQVETWLKGKISELPEWVKKLLGIASRSKVFYSIGRYSMQGFYEGMESLADMPQKVIANSALSAMRPAMAAQPISTNYYRNSTLNMGGVNINNGMDFATLENLINRMIQR